MSEKTRDTNILHWLVAAASVVIIIAGLKSAQSLVVPFLVAAFIAVICTPALDWLQKKGVPSALALVLVIAGVTLILVSIIAIAGSSINDFSENSQDYQQKLLARAGLLQEWLIDRGLIEEEDVKNFFENHLNLGAAFSWFRGFLASLTGLFSNALLVLLLLIFMLAEASGLPRKLLAITDGRK